MSERERQGGESVQRQGGVGEGAISPGKRARTDAYTKRPENAESEGGEREGEEADAPKGVLQKKDKGEAGGGSNSHRGRIQVQGGGLELSRSWTQDKPRSKDQGQADLTSLKGELSKSALKERDEAFANASDFVNTTSYTAPPDLHKTFQNRAVRQRKGDERVDIEIIMGTAFA